MNVRLDVAELTRVLQQTPAHQNVMLVGRHGIGKSQIIAKHFAERGMTVVPFFLGQMSDPGDLIGLLHKDETTGRSEFLPPYWWPTSDQPIVLFLDELNRARPEILQAVMELALNKTLAGKALPGGSVLVSAVNAGDDYHLTDLDPALVSRFNVYEFAPTIDDWLAWAAQHDVDYRVIDLIAKQPHLLDGENQGDAMVAGSDLVRTPDRRSWARVSELIAGRDPLDAVDIKMVAGVVGAAAASAFRASLQAPLPVTPEQLLMSYSKHTKKIEKLSLPECIAMNEQLVAWISRHEKTLDGDKVSASLACWIKCLEKRKLQEAVAHFATLLDRPQGKAAEQTVAESIELTRLLTDYLASVQIS
ncbi:MAG: AAA family ATPase [Planctomycetota bacterium]